MLRLGSERVIDFAYLRGATCCDLGHLAEGICLLCVDLEVAWVRVERGEEMRHLAFYSC